MSEPQLPTFEPDEATLARDDALLDALGSGVRLPGEDTLAMALYMWREDLSAPPKAAAERARRKKRRITWGIIAAALAAALGTGATVAAAASNAKPDSPLWPITQWVYPGQASTASVAAAKERIANAETAVDENHLPEANKLLDEAETLIANVTSLLDKQALMADVQRVRALLNAVVTGTPGPTPAPSAVPVPAPGGSTGPTPGVTPSPGRTGGLPLPLPTISVPPLLPSLPLG